MTTGFISTLLTVEKQLQFPFLIISWLKLHIYEQQGRDGERRLAVGRTNLEGPARDRNRMQGSKQIEIWRNFPLKWGMRCAGRWIFRNWLIRITPPNF